MIRALFVIVASISALATAAPGSPDTCTLLTAKDASAMVGQSLTVAPNSGGINCRYTGAGGPAVLGVELTVRVDPDVATAHADFPKWVLPFKGSTGLTITSVPNLGDEATVVRGSIVSGVYFRHGATLMKIGVHPPVGDAALKTAATTVLSRL
jgi:hypothetical protein